MNLISWKKLFIAFAATVIFPSLGAFHGTASAQVQYVIPGIDVTAPPWNCREEWVDWMGAGSGWTMMICDSWDFTPPPPRDIGDLGPPPPDGSGFGGVGASPSEPRTEQEFIRHFKRTANLCKKSTEDCNVWGQRIGRDYCAHVRPSGLISVCNNAHSEQAAVGCPDVACP
jgi:hypothetical protein